VKKNVNIARNEGRSLMLGLAANANIVVKFAIRNIIINLRKINARKNVVFVEKK
jgi:hypothetical protein